MIARNWSERAAGFVVSSPSLHPLCCWLVCLPQSYRHLASCQIVPHVAAVSSPSSPYKPRCRVGSAWAVDSSTRGPWRSSWAGVGVQFFAASPLSAALPSARAASVPLPRWSLPQSSQYHRPGRAWPVAVQRETDSDRSCHRQPTNSSPLCQLFRRRCAYRQSRWACRRPARRSGSPRPGTVVARVLGMIAIEPRQPRPVRVRLRPSSCTGRSP